MIPALFTRMCSGWPVARNLSAKASIEAGVEQVHRLDLDVESFQRGRGLIVIARRDDDLGAGGTQHPRGLPSEAHVFEARSLDELEGAFDSMTRWHPGANRWRVGIVLSRSSNSRQRLLAVAGFANGEALLFEVVAQHRDDRDLVIDDEDERLQSRSLPRAAPSS